MQTGAATTRMAMRGSCSSGTSWWFTVLPRVLFRYKVNKNTVNNRREKGLVNNEMKNKILKPSEYLKVCFNCLIEAIRNFNQDPTKESVEDVWYWIGMYSDTYKEVNGFRYAPNVEDYLTNSKAKLIYSSYFNNLITMLRH